MRFKGAGFALALAAVGCGESPRQEGRDLARPPDLIVIFDFSAPDQAKLADLAVPKDGGAMDLPAPVDMPVAMDLPAQVDLPVADAVQPADLALPKADLEINYCIIQFPKATTTKANVATEPIFGQVYQKGLTDANMGVAPGMVAQLGYGPQGTDPRISNAWVWVDAKPNMNWNFAQNNDEYVATLTVANLGGYSYAYRFSVTQGMGFTYCDTIGNGSNMNLPLFDPQKDGLLTVN